MKALGPTQNLCHHDFENHFEMAGPTPRCYFCNIFVNIRIRTKCRYCNLVLCSMCARHKLNLEVLVLLELVHSTTDYPTLVRDFYANLSHFTGNEDGDFELQSYVKGKPMKLTVHILAQILGTTINRIEVYVTNETELQ